MAWWGNSQEPKRALSLFIHPDFYSLFITPLLALLLPDLFERIKISWKQHAGWILLWLFGAAGLFFSLSRAGWFGLAAAVTVYVLIAADQKIRRLIYGVVIIIFIIVFAVPNFRYRLILPFLGEKSAVSRFSLWNTGWKGIKESPVTGLGLDGFGNNWLKLNTDPNLDTHNFPHNIFLDFWVDTGILGLVAFVGLVSVYLYRGLKVKTFDSTTHYRPFLQFSIALFLIALLAHGQFDNPYFKNDLALVFWLILSLTL